jgi:hypothetical protein
MTENEVKMASLKKAGEYREWGGLMPFLMHEIPGVKDFVVSNLIANPIPSAKFLKQFLAAFPALPPDQIPSLTTIKSFRKKIGDEADDNPDSRAMVLKDFRRNLAAFKNLNFVEEQMKLYEVLQRLVYDAVVAKNIAVDVMRRTGKVPNKLWKALTGVAKIVGAASKQLGKLDDLAVRFGLMPPKNEKYLILAQFFHDKLILSEEQKKTMIQNELGLTRVDFRLPNLQETAKKVMFYIAKQYDIDYDEPEFISNIRDISELKNFQEEYQTQRNTENKA